MYDKDKIDPNLKKAMKTAKAQMGKRKSGRMGTEVSLEIEMTKPAKRMPAFNVQPIRKSPRKRGK